MTSEPSRSHCEYDGSARSGVRHYHDRHRCQMPLFKLRGAPLEADEVGRKPAAEILVEAQRDLRLEQSFQRRPRHQNPHQTQGHKGVEADFRIPDVLLLL
jgi:hypothetical protein